LSRCLKIGLWNATKFCETLADLVDSIDDLKVALGEYEGIYRTALQVGTYCRYIL
jgi:hypothetical protein